MHHKNNTFLYKKCWIFSIKKPIFFWVFLNKKCVSEKRSKTFKIQNFFTKIAIEIAILSQEYSKTYRNFCRNFVAIFSTSLQHRFSIASTSFQHLCKLFQDASFNPLQNSSKRFNSFRIAKQPPQHVWKRLKTFEIVWKRLKMSHYVSSLLTAVQNPLKNGQLFLPSAGQKKNP